MSRLRAYHVLRRATHTAAVTDVDNSRPGEVVYMQLPVCEECAARMAEHNTSRVTPLGTGSGGCVENNPVDRD